MTMTDARVREILAAYGASPALWPDAERAAVLAHLRARTDAAAMLEAEGALDDLLAVSMVPPPSVALAERVLRDAPAPPWSKRVRLWWAAAALAAGASGVLAGSTAAAAFAPVDLPDGRADATAFGAVLDPGAQEAAE